MEPLLEQIVDLARADRRRARWIVVPSSALGQTLGERLARAGVAWTNLRFTTADALAARVAGPSLAASGVLPADDGIGPALCLQLLFDLPPEVPRYFRRIADQPGVGDALWRSVSDLRLAGLHAADLPAAAFADPAKHAELAALLAAYEAWLARESRADAAGVLRAAIAAPRKWPVTEHSDLLEMPGACGSALEREFLDSLPAQRIAAREFETPRAVRRDSERLAWIASPGDATAALHDGTLTLFHAAGREAEVEEVMRRILRDRTPLDEVEIVCAQPAEYAPLLWEKAARLGIPLTVETGIPGLLTRPVRAALAFCDWIESDFAAARLARMFDAGLLAPSGDLSASAAAAVLRRSNATAGRETYAAALAALAASSEERSRDADLDDEVRETAARRAVRARALAVWLGPLLDSVPAGPVARAGDMVASVTRMLEESASVGAPEEAAAREAALAALAALRPLEGLERPLGFVLALIRERLRSITVLASRPQPGAAHVSPLVAPGHSGRSVTFFVGLEEGAVFPSSLEDPALLDEERAQIAPERLRRSADYISDQTRAALARVAGATGRVTFSYSTRDLRNGRQTYPSWIVFHAARLMLELSTLKLDDLTAFLGDPATLVAAGQDGATSDLAWWLSGLRGAGAAALPAVAAAFPGIARGLAAGEARGSAAFTEFDGFVPAAGLDLDPRSPERVYSPSALERYAECPFRFFLERGLGLDPELDEEPDPNTWLDPLVRGSFLHDVYRDFLRRLRREQRRPVAADWNALWAIAVEGLEKLRREIPPPGEGVRRAEMQQIERDLRLFLRLEIERDGVEPVAVEAPFGLGDPDPDEPLSRREPIAIELGGAGAIRLRGRIDRIDWTGDGRYEVIDYKTGGLFREKFAPNFAGGRLLQHALYAQAARQMLADAGLPARAVSASYYFCTERAWGEWVRKDGLNPRPVVRALAEALGAGAFLRGGEESKCRRCDYRRACPGDEVRNAAAKTEDPGAGVRALVRLRSHE